MYFTVYDLMVTGLMFLWSLVLKSWLNNRSWNFSNFLSFRSNSKVQNLRHKLIWFLEEIIRHRTLQSSQSSYVMLYSIKNFTFLFFISLPNRTMQKRIWKRNLRLCLLWHQTDVAPFIHCSAIWRTECFNEVRGIFSIVSAHFKHF